MNKPTVHDADGLMWADHGGEIGDEAIGWNDHEAPLGPILEGLLPDGGVFLDVGAQVGRWALRLARRASRVIAVEPNPAAVAVLAENVRLNQLANVTVLEVAAWDRTQTLQVVNPHPFGTAVTGWTRTMEGDVGGISVQARRLDEVVITDRLDLVKLDVEGADIHVLRGMQGLLEAHGPTLLIELHHMFGYYQRPDLEAVLARFGYGWRAAAQWNASEYIICTKAGG